MSKYIDQLCKVADSVSVDVRNGRAKVSGRVSRLPKGDRVAKRAPAAKVKDDDVFDVLAAVVGDFGADTVLNAFVERAGSGKSKEFLQGFIQEYYDTPEVAEKREQLLSLLTSIPASRIAIRDSRQRSAKRRGVVSDAADYPILSAADFKFTSTHSWPNSKVDDYRLQNPEKFGFKSCLLRITTGSVARLNGAYFFIQYPDGSEDEVTFSTTFTVEGAVAELNDLFEEISTFTADMVKVENESKVSDATSGGDRMMYDYQDYLRTEIGLRKSDVYAVPAVGSADAVCMALAQEPYIVEQFAKFSDEELFEAVEATADGMKSDSRQEAIAALVWIAALEIQEMEERDAAEPYV